MTRCPWILVLVALIAGPIGSRAELPSSIWSAAIAQKNGADDNGQANGEKKDKDEEEAPKHIRDNGFFVEEAVNQEAGEVQHIFNWINFWDRTARGRTRDFAATYTMELPLGSQKHQFSFTTLFLTEFEKLNGQPATQRGDVGDTLLNYRYQLLSDDDFLWCAPRFSLIVPTGDRRFGSGTGSLGYQLNLPISRYTDHFDFHFNAGATYIPDVSVPLPTGVFSAGRPLRAASLGLAAYWKPQVNLHFFVELFGLWNESFDDRAIRGHQTQVLVNPGFRYAVCQLENVEWVVGFSLPVGLTRDSPDIGIFAYMSIEHAFKKKEKNGEDK